jgi:hypothetical protein
MSILLEAEITTLFIVFFMQVQYEITGFIDFINILSNYWGTVYIQDTPHN